MRKLISMVVALSVGVSAGLRSSELWIRARTRVLPYCEVARNAEAYHLRFVRVSATVDFGRGEMFISEDCDSHEALEAWVEFEDGDWPALGTGYERALLLSDPTKKKTADVIVEGEFNANAPFGCYGPKFRIMTSKVRLITPVPAFEPR